MGIKGKGRWPDIESWKSYGVERGYNERNPSSLYLSSNSDEKSHTYTVVNGVVQNLPGLPHAGIGKQ